MPLPPRSLPDSSQARSWHPGQPTVCCIACIVASPKVAFLFLSRICVLSPLEALGGQGIHIFKNSFWTSSGCPVWLASILNVCLMRTYGSMNERAVTVGCHWKVRETPTSHIGCYLHVGLGVNGLSLLCCVALSGSMRAPGHPQINPALQALGPAAKHKWNLGKDDLDLPFAKSTKNPSWGHVMFLLTVISQDHITDGKHILKTPRTFKNGWKHFHSDIYFFEKTVLYYQRGF